MVNAGMFPNVGPPRRHVSAGGAEGAEDGC